MIIDTADHVAEDLMGVVRNAAALPMQNSVDPPQDEVHIPEQPILEDESY